MHDILQENDYKFVIIPDEAMTVNEFISFVKSFGTTFFDGYLVYNVQKNDELIDYFKQNNINFVVLGITDDPQVHHICTRHEKGIFDGMVELKREKVNSYILLLNRSNSQVVASQRESGFNFACEILSLPKEVAHVFYYSNNAEAMDILQKILEESLDFKGIICSGGLLNIVSFLCEKEHKMIGIDISLILYDYWSFNENNSYYTIIQQPVKELSIAAIQTLLNLINDNKYHVIQTEFNPKLIFGVSSKNREE
jgi:DNA-binding LacI/PurR family transcriptional regulator